MSSPSHRLAAVWFADISRYSRLARADEGASLALVRAFQAIARREIPRHGGRAVKFMGDGVMAEFPSALGAVQAALALHAAYGAEAPGELADAHPVRSAIHVGEVHELEDSDLYGDGVNVAARILAEAEPGEVMVSEDVRRLLRGQRVLGFRALGERRLRGVGRIGLYSARPAGTLVQAPPSTPAPRSTPSRPRAVTLVAAAAVLLVLVVARFGGIDPSRSWVGFRTTVQPAIAGPVATSIAVLPFEGEDLEATRVSGFTDAIVGRLAGIPDIILISPSSTSRFGSDGRSIADAARSLGVESVLRGAVSRRRDGDVRVEAELVFVETGEVLWRGTWTRPTGELAALQIEIAERIVDGLRLELSARALQRVQAPSSRDPEAHRMYQAGLHHWNRRSADGVRLSIETFRRALDRDPGYAAAYAGLAAAYVLAPAYSDVPRESAESWARAAAEKAIELDPGLGEPHAVLGLIAFHEWDWPTAEREFRRAIDLGPGWATAHHWLAIYLTSMGRHEEAEAAFERAEALDPLSLAVVSAHGVVYLNQGDFDGAIGRYREALAMDPAFGPAHGNLIEIYQLTGRFEEAIREMRESGRAGPDVDELERGLRSGGPRGYLAALARLMEARGATAFEMAVVSAALDDIDGCLEWLEESYRRREPGLVDLLTHPGLEPVRDDPRYRELLSRLNFS